MKVRVPNHIEAAVKREFDRQYEANAKKMAQKKAKEEVWRANEQVFRDMDAAVLYALHKSCGFGKKRLVRFYREFGKIYKELEEFYMFDKIPGAKSGDSVCWYADRELKKIGVNVSELQSRSE